QVDAPVGLAAAAEEYRRLQVDVRRVSHAVFGGDGQHVLARANPRLNRSVARRRDGGGAVHQDGGGLGQVGGDVQDRRRRGRPDGRLRLAAGGGVGVGRAGQDQSRQAHSQIPHGLPLLAQQPALLPLPVAVGGRGPF